MPEHKHTILIVEDNDDVRHILQMFIEQLGFRVINASDGIKAMETLVNELPALIIMDINMPIIDGFTAARRIRQQEHLRQVPIVFITAHGALGIELFQEHLNTLEGGPIEYLPKPIDKHLLDDLIKRMKLDDAYL
jgi:two-component system, cell cycle response regulator DivK